MVGDGLRRVHWPSSAKKQELMIRKMETPWRSRALVLLDVRSSVYESQDAFEQAVSGAASVITHLVQSGFEADLWAGESRTIDAGQYAATMERLALVQPIQSIDLGSALGRVHRRGAGGALVLVTGAADRPLLGVQQLLGPAYPTTLLMCASSTIPQALSAFQRTGVNTVTVAPGDKWAGAWLIAMRSTWRETSAS